MQHLDEYTIELYILGSDLVDDQRQEINAHLKECHGCRALADRMKSFYTDADTMLGETSVDGRETGKALMRVSRYPVPFNDPLGDPIQYTRQSPVSRFAYFVRRYPVVAGVGGFGLAAALVLFGMIISSPFKGSDRDVITDRNPAHVNYNSTTDMLEVLNAEHQLLWQRKSPGIDSARWYEEDQMYEGTTIEDLDGDGTNEILTSLHLLGYETSVHDKPLLVFRHDGKILWRKKFVETVHYLDRKYSPYFNVMRAVVANDDLRKEKNIFVTVNNADRSPSFVQRLDHTGAILGTYWHFGIMVNTYLRDLDADGRPELILCGKNDGDDTTRNEFSSIAVLDPFKIVGQSRSTTCPGYNLSPSDAEIYYIKFPRTDIEVAQRTTGITKRLVMNDSATLKFTVSRDYAWSIDYFFDHRMRILDVKSYDVTDVLHKQLVAEGKLTGSIDRAYLENLKQGVRYWDGREWKKDVCRVVVDGPQTVVPPP